MTAAGDFRRAGSFFSDKVTGTLAICGKLAELERAWPEIAGAAMSENSSLAACEFGEKGLVLKINISSASLMSAVKFRKAALRRKAEAFLKVPVTDIVFAVGKVKRISDVKDPLPEYKRRAPMVISDEKVEEEAKFLEAETGDEELSRSMARIKVITERWQSRKKH